MSSNQSGEGEIRKAIIEADLVDCMVALPGQLFYSTQIPVCLWFLARDKKGEGGRVKGENESSNFKLHSSNFRARKGETLFIDARKLGTMIDRVHRELTDEDVRIIADTYHAWISLKGEMRSVKYADVPGFCKSATLDDIRHHGHILTPGRYVGAAEVEDDGEPFEEKMARLTAELRTQTVESARLDTLIWANLRSLKLEG
jgi:type I restriction enzyme M protein